jgi:hypothetical protein
MRSSFDPIPALAAALHDGVCPSTHPAIAPGDCVLAYGAAASLRERLAAGGLVVAPTLVITWARRMLAGASDGEVEQDAPPAAAGSSESRARAAYWIEFRHDDGRRSADGPHQQWLAELVIGEMAWFRSDPSIVSARLVPGWARLS